MFAEHQPSPTLGGLSTGATPTPLGSEFMRARPPQAQHGQHDLDLSVPCGTLAGHPTAMEAYPQSAAFVGSRQMA